MLACWVLRETKTYKDYSHRKPIRTTIYLSLIQFKLENDLSFRLAGNQSGINSILFYEIKVHMAAVGRSFVSNDLLVF